MTSAKAWVAWRMTWMFIWCRPTHMVPRRPAVPNSSGDVYKRQAMVIAGLAAQGTTEIGCIHHIERGYEDIVRKLSGVGADIRVVVTPDEEKQSQVG